MLEFFGLAEEAGQLLICCIVLGLAIGMQIGAFSAYGDTERKSAKAGRIVFLIISILMGVAALFMGFLPAMAMFFTFHWGVLLRSIILGIVVGTVAGFIVHWIVLAGRRKRYMRSPIMKETVKFCKDHHIVGIQCFKDELRFFTAIVDVNYCEKDQHVQQESGQSTADAYMAGWRRPSSWVAYDSPSCYVATLRFADRGYPDLPDLTMFASALAHKLGGFRYASHTRSVQYDTSTFDTITHHTVHLYADCFVFRSKDYRQLKKLKKKAIAARQAHDAKQKKNTWE